VVRDVAVNLTRGTKVVNIALTSAQAATLARDGSALISFETPAGEVQALDLGLAKPKLWFTATRGAAEDDDHGARRQVLLSVDVTGTEPFPGTPTGTVRFQKDGRDLGGPVALDEDGHAELRVPDPSGTLKHHVLRAVYSGDGDYVAATATLPRKPGNPQGGSGPGKVKVSCRVAGKRRVRCMVRNANASQHLKAKLRLAGTQRVVTRSGEGRVRVTLKSRDKLTGRPRVVARVTRAGTTTRMVVRARRP